MKTIEMIRSLERSERFALRNSYEANITTLVTIKKSMDKPSETVAEFVKAIGYRPALLTIASLVNRRNDDGRLDRSVTGWASGIDDALDPEAAFELGCNTDAIHMAHLNQIAQAMMQYSPYDHLTDDEPQQAVTEEAQPTETDFDRSEFAPDHITVFGMVMKAEYRISSTGRSITVKITYDDGTMYRVVFSGVCGELFTACKRAAQGATVEVDGNDVLTVFETATEIKPREIKPREINPDKQAHGEVPEKLWIGSELTGKSWRILFDGDAGKTRVIFDRVPSQGVREAVKAAGFYWSPSMKSWNKGLTWKAFRAAQALHAELFKIA